MDSLLYWSIISLSIFQAFVVVVSKDVVFTRDVKTVELRPSSPGNESTPNLYHTIAKGPEDVLHYISGTFGFPSVLVACTNTSAELVINWENFLSDNLTLVAQSLRFIPEAHYVYALQFLNLIEYNDMNDTANLMNYNDTNHTISYNLGQGVPWANSAHLSLLEDNIVVFSINTNYTDAGDTPVNFMSGGSFSLRMNMNNMSVRSDDLPHLQLSGNTSLVDVTIDHMEPVFPHTRYALEVVYIDTQPSTTQIHTEHSIDDEYTPGVFQLVEVSSNSTQPSYIQWKPVCYKSAARSMKTATKVKHYDLTPGETILPKIRNTRSLLYAYLGADMYSADVNMVAINVSFGLSEDKFYAGTYYTSWTLTLGHGAAPQEQVSTLILIIISVGLGLPVLIIMFGSLGACIHKKKKANSDSGSYTVIN